ncbi:MAG: hypothetical protein ABW001_13900 [Mycobacterium sp.]
MRLVADAGVWTIGPSVPDAPAVAVLEVSGGVLAWTVDDPAGPAATRITVTDVAAADWLWRVVGPGGHAAIVAALPENGDIELSDVDLLPQALAPLRRLAIGHWLRRWWPESSRDGIVRLDHALLDGELAVLVAAADEFFTEDTLDSDVEGLLSPHQAALLALERAGDPRIGEIVRACLELADDLGVWDAAVAPALQERRDDYALAAGRDGARRPGAIASGVGSVDWVGVPPGIFDAADQTVEWSVESVDSSVLAVVRVATTGERPATGIEVRLRSGAITAAGVLDGNGTAALPILRGDGGAGGSPLTETQAWDHDWSTTSVNVGAVDSNDPAAQAIRQRVRDFARRRLASPSPDAFLAEIIAAEADY